MKLKLHISPFFVLMTVISITAIMFLALQIKKLQRFNKPVVVLGSKHIHHHRGEFDEHHYGYNHNNRQTHRNRDRDGGHRRHAHPGHHNEYFVNMP